MNWLVALLLLVATACGVSAAGGDPLETNVFHSFFPALVVATKDLAVTIQVRFIAIQSEARFEAWAPYHPTAKGKYLGASLKRPVAEHTTRNKNVAIAYVTTRTICDQVLNKAACGIAQDVMTSLGLDPHSQIRDPSSPIGVGNLAADAVIHARHNDGMNQLGDADGSGYNSVNFTDYTGYLPVNDHLHIRDPDAWQPLIKTDAKNRPVSQLYLTPQLELLKTLVVDTKAASVADQKDRYDEHRGLYVKKTLEVMHAQRHLTERQKLVGEFFDDKVRAFAGFGEYLIAAYGNGTLDFHTIFNFVVNSVVHESMAPIWKLKTKYDAVRPITSIRFLFGERPIIGWGGPGQGNVLLKGKHWNSYLMTDAFPEYPSGTTCICAAWATAARLLTGTNNIAFRRVIPAGASVIEPGFTPQQDLTIAFDSFTQVINECALSRVWGGVHYFQAVEEAKTLCKPYGEQFYQKAMDLINGV